MSEIIIEKAPEQYQRYLTIGDAKGNFNKKIDGAGEAKISADELCDEESIKDCLEFLEYLEKSGYVLSQLEKKSVASPVATEEEETGEKIETLIKDLGDKKQAVRWSTVEKIINYINSDIPQESKAKVVDHLIKALQDKNWYVRGNVVWILEKAAIPDVPPTSSQTWLNPLSRSCRTKTKIFVQPQCEPWRSFWSSWIFLWV